MKPIIGITGGLDGDSLRLRQDYVSAIVNSGGLPVVLPVYQQAAELSDLIDGLLLTGGADIPAYLYGGKDTVPEEYITLERKGEDRFRDRASEGNAPERKTDSGRLLRYAAP